MRRRYQTGRLFKSGDLWYGRWYESVFENGKWKRKNRYECLGKGKKEASEALQLHLARVNSPLYKGVHVLTFTQFSESWQEKTLPTMKRSTALNYRVIIRKHLLPYFGEVQIGQIGPEAVQGFITKLQCSPKTIRNIVNCLRSMWKTAEAWGYVQHDAFRGLHLPQVVKSDRPYFTLEEIRKILFAAPEPYRTFYWLAAETGLRAGELCGLYRTDIGDGVLTIRRSVWRGKVQSTKSAAACRTICISEELQNALLSLGRSESPFLFHSRVGTAWDANLLVKRKIVPLCNCIGIAPRGLHAFRHGQATLLDQAHVPVKVRQQRLGHTSAELTIGTYTHVVTADERKFADDLGAVLNGNEQKNKKPELAELTNSGLIN